MNEFTEKIVIEKLEGKQEIVILLEGFPDEEFDDFLLIRARLYLYNGVKTNFIYELFSHRVLGNFSNEEALMIGKLKLVNYLADIQHKVTFKEI